MRLPWNVGPEDDPPITTITAADLVAWKKHADLLLLVSKMLAIIVAGNPCQCGECSHCQKIAWLEVDVKTATTHAQERLAWLAERVRTSAA